jgi:hypothetical protein
MVLKWLIMGTHTDSFFYNDTTSGGGRCQRAYFFVRLVVWRFACKYHHPNEYINEGSGGGDVCGRPESLHCDTTMWKSH